MANNICLYFQVHQPVRLSKINFWDIGKSMDIFEGSGEHMNKDVFQKVSNKCYLPTNKILLKLLNRYPEFKICFSFSGVFLEQAEKYSPSVIKSFKKLVDTGRVEILSETYHHSLASVYSLKEFLLQIQLHRKIVGRIFRKMPGVFRNTELIYSDYIGSLLSELGFSGVLAEGWDDILKDKSPNYMYEANTVNLSGIEKKLVSNFKIRKSPSNNFKILTKNYKLSDDVAFRFSDKNWSEYPLTAKKWIEWVGNQVGDYVGIFIDYETFGEHQWNESGIFKFLQKIPYYASKTNIGFKTPTEIIKKSKSMGKLSYIHPVSWADSNRDLSAWNGNQMQRDALKRLYSLEKKFVKNTKLLNYWRYLQISDHFYYMSTKTLDDGDVHKYFSPYNSPYNAYINYMNALENLKVIVP